MSRSATALLLAGFVALGATACPKSTPSSMPPVASTQSGGDSGSFESSNLEPCGPAGERFASLSFVPRSIRLAALVDLESAELADALEALAAVAEKGEPLPIDVAFAARQWSWEVPLVRRTLEDAGFRPAELLRLRTEDGLVAWFWSTQCDLDLARARVEERWKVRTRATVDAVIGTPSEGSSFAFDVVFLEGDRAALVPRGRGAELGAALEQPPTLAGSLGADTQPVHEALAGMGAAPVRMVVRGQALVAGTRAAEAGYGFVRATGAGVEFGGSLAPK